MHSLSGDKDSTMERRTIGAKNPLQCLRGSVQIRPPPSRVSTGCQPYLCSIFALQLSQEGVRDEKAGGAGDPYGSNGWLAPMAPEH